MKIIHTSDWHIGKLVNGLHVTEEQEKLLEKVTQYLQKNKPDMVLISGDIYDRTIPPSEAITLLNTILYRWVVEMDIPIVMTSGNHDSSERLGFGSALLNKQGLYIVTTIEEALTPIVVNDEFGVVHIYAIPYIEPLYARVYFKDENLKTHEDVFRVITEKINSQSKGERVILMAHGLFVGNQVLETCESERALSVGGLDAISVEWVKNFDYVALGHLHKAQKVTYDHVRYAGSLMKYSFSEVLHEKGINLVSLNRKGFQSCEKIVFKPEKDMRTIEGKLEELIKPEVVKAANHEDFLRVILTDEELLYEPLYRLRQHYPNVLRMEQRALKSEIQSQSSIELQKKSPMALFEQFYTQVADAVLTSEQRAFVEMQIEKTLKEVETQ